jgi:hypothetical protein
MHDTLNDDLGKLVRYEIRGELSVAVLHIHPIKLCASTHVSGYN